MKKIIFLILSLFYVTFANSLYPSFTIKVDGGIEDMVLSDNKLAISTDNGKALLYDLESKKIIKKIQLPNIKDFMGDSIKPHVFSIDYLNGKLIFASDSGKGGYANVWINENNQTKQIFSSNDLLFIVKLRLIDKNHVLFAFLGNDISLYDINKKKLIYNTQLNESKFSDFEVNEDRTKAAFANESGVNFVVDTKSGKILKTLKGQNVDNVFSIDIKKDLVTAGGKDRRAVYCNLLTDSNGYFKGTFFIYATAISPSGKKIAYAMNEDNSITIYDFATKEKIATLKGVNSKVSKIIFKDDNTVIVAEDGGYIKIWNLKEKK